MNCREVKQLLYQYIENDLDKNTVASIKKHLSVCKDCAEELAFAKAYKKEMSSLKGANAPADFLGKLNLRIDEANKKSFFSRIIDTLFFPLKIKLPVEAAGLLAVTVLIVLMFNPVEKYEKSMFVPDKKEYAKKEAKAGAGIQIAEKQRFIKEIEKNMIASNAKMRTKAPAAVMEKRDLATETEADVYEIAIVIRQPQSFQQSMPADSMPRAASGAMGEEAEAHKSKDDVASKSAQKSEPYPGMTFKNTDNLAKAERKSKIAEEGAQDKLAGEKAYKTKARVLKEVSKLQSQSIYIQNSISEIKKIALGMKGRIIGEDFNRKDNTNLIIVEIPAYNQQIFIDRLNSVGSIKSQEQRVRLKRTGNVQYNINVKEDVAR